MSETVNPRTKRVREALIAATMSIVAERDVNDISLTEIAEAAQVSRPTVYKQFKDTYSLVAEATIQLMDEVFARIDEELAVADHDSIGYLERLIVLFVGSVYENRTFCKNAMHGPSAAAVNAYVVNMLDERMAHGLVGKRLALAGDLAPDFRRALSAGVVWLLEEWLESDFAGENEPMTFAQRLTSVLVDFSMAGSLNK